MTDQTTTETLYQVPITAIVPSRWQPRQSFDPEALLELAKNIRDHGLMYPVILFINEDGEHELVAGERRTRALAALALTHTPAWTDEHGPGLRKAIAHIAEDGWIHAAPLLDGTAITARIEPNTDHRRLHELAIADNIQRENLTPLEEARALDDLMTEYGLSQRDVAAQIGWSQSKVQERLSLLGLAPQAAVALTARAISTSHARHLARLPQEIQAAVTGHVQELVDREGDQAATVRQVASLTQQLRKFLNPDHWLPPPGEVLTPETRNHLRLVRTILLVGVDLEARAGDILALRSLGYDKSNLTGKKPATLNEWHLRHVIAALTGRRACPVDEAWAVLAEPNNWTCDHCQLRDGQPPARNTFTTPCPRWTRDWENDADSVPNTCTRFIAAADPLIIPLQTELAKWIEKFDPAALHRDPFYYLVDLATWRTAVERATELCTQQQAHAQHKRDNRHIVALAEYWQQQRTGLFAAVDHFQAHLCPRCTHHRPQLLDQDLPPCQFTTDPLTERWNDDPLPLATGVLVRSDGLMLPRCAFFRIVVQGLAPSPGFALPNREAVLEWARLIVKSYNRNDHHNTLPAPLAWLPYHRPGENRIHDLDALLAYLKRSWDDLGDERIATLLTALAYEARANTNYNQPFDLLDPTTLQVESWAAVRWRTAVHRETIYGSYPAGWPRPWEETEGD